MADTLTTNYSLVKPEIGASTTTWGNKLNTNLDTIDVKIKLALDNAAAAQTTANTANTTANANTTTKLSLSGGTMTGTLVLAADPTSALHASTKQYVDNAVSTATGNVTSANYMPKSGGTFTGSVSISGANFVYLNSNGSVNCDTTWTYLRGPAIAFQNPSGGNLALLDSSGNFTATANVTAYSDARLKTNVETIYGALDLVNRMRGVRYTRIDSGDIQVGVIAQELREVVPEAVIAGTEYLSVAYGNLVGVLIEAVKELTSRVEELEAK